MYTKEECAKIAQTLFTLARTRGYYTINSNSQATFQHLFKDAMEQFPDDEKNDLISGLQSVQVSLRSDWLEEQIAPYLANTSSSS